MSFGFGYCQIIVPWSNKRSIVEEYTSKLWILIFEYCDPMILSNGRALSIDFRIFVNDLTNCIRFYYRQRLHYFRMEIFGFEYCEQVLNIILWKYRQWFEKYSIMSSLLYERFRMLLILIFHCSILSFSNMSLNVAIWQIYYELAFIWTSFEDIVVARQIFDYELAFIWRFSNIVNIVIQYMNNNIWTNFKYYFLYIFYIILCIYNFHIKLRFSQISIRVWWISISVWKGFQI